MSLLPFLTCTEHLDLVRILDCLVHYINHVLGFFICGLAVSILELGAGALLKHDKGAYLLVL